MSDQSWNVFGNCPTCKAAPGEPCRNTRARERPASIRPPTKRAHRDREQLAVPLPVKRDPDIPWRYR